MQSATTSRDIRVSMHREMQIGMMCFKERYRILNMFQNIIMEQYVKALRERWRWIEIGNDFDASFASRYCSHWTGVDALNLQSQFLQLLKQIDPTTADVCYAGWGLREKGTGPVEKIYKLSAIGFSESMPFL